MLSIYHRYVDKIHSAAIRCWVYPKGYKCFGRRPIGSSATIETDINGRSLVIVVDYGE